MATDNSQLDFRLKIYVLELDTVPVTMAPPLPPTTAAAIQQSSSSSAAAAATASTVGTASSVTDYVTRTIDTFDVSRNNIDYRAEGNANIVLAIPHRCQVLRLPKKSKRLYITHYSDSNSELKACLSRSFICFFLRFFPSLTRVFVCVAFCLQFAFLNNLHLTLKPMRKTKIMKEKSKRGKITTTKTDSNA